MNKPAVVLLALVVAIIVGAIGWLVTSRPANAPVLAPTTETQAVPLAAPSPATATLTTFQPQIFTAIKAPHFVAATPLHGEVYAAQPINVTINFNFDLAEGSTITVRSMDGQEWQEGDVTIEDAQTALKVSLKQGMPDGQYAVDYTACWPDKSCHDGQFSFDIDSSKQSAYQDQRGQKEITIHMKDIAFRQQRVIISPGTKVTWVNDESVGHFVNTETHPEHTYFVPHNSREIKQGESFTTSFDIPGQYNYHCSAHVPEGMLGSIIVAS